MALWKIQPVARPDDPRWLDHDIWQEVLVRAPTAALARRLASTMERDPDAPLTGNECPSFASAFEDEKLYQVSRLPAAEEAVIQPDIAPAGEAPYEIVRARKLPDDAEN